MSYTRPSMSERDARKFKNSFILSAALLTTAVPASLYIDDSMKNGGFFDAHATVEYNVQEELKEKPQSNIAELRISFTKQANALEKKIDDIKTWTPFLLAAFSGAMYYSMKKAQARVKFENDPPKMS